jgi:menaquinone-9 beta-reductase
MQEDGCANLCLSFDPARLPGRPEALLRALEPGAPLLIERAAAAGGWCAIAGVPYGWRSGEAAAGRFRLGDQAAVIASLAGDGVAIALASAASAVDAWQRHGPAGAAGHQRGFAGHARRPLAIATLARRLAESRILRPPALALLRRLPLLPGLARATRIGAH